MTGFETRRAVPAEGAALCALLDASYEPYRDRGIAIPDVTEGLDAEIAVGRVWVATQNRDILGLLNLSVTPPNAHLINVAVSANAKGQGVGGALIRHAIAQAERAGCTTLDLGTHADLSENISLYQHLGWGIIKQDAQRVRMRLALNRGG
ncbi:GNAT family N-acetyltransferase [uncultured Shimia sp.]|uniref:GNAT family N-acetyltransferase n=1 Tax=uncultured Shimia sp. TaxID=573152 RepID=UPI0026370C9D|nr:GNAT family N-acetyltransferase [uncultured Shimia sp.]